MDFHDKYPSPLDRLPPSGLADPQTPATRPVRDASVSHLIDDLVEDVLEEVSDFLQAQQRQKERTAPVLALPAPPPSDDPSPQRDPQPEPQCDPQREAQPAPQRETGVEQRAFGASPVLRAVCQGVTVAGEPCRSFARNGAPFCFMHDPASAEDVAAARAGGAARVNALKKLEEAAIGSYQELRDFNTELLRSAAAGHLSPQAIYALRTSLTFQHKLIHDAYYERQHGRP